MDITEIIKSIAAVLAAIITYIIAPYIKAKTTESQQATINEWVRIAVSAAEQLYAGSERGTEKKRYVYDWLKARNINVDEDEIDALIESAVHELNKGLIL